MSAGKGDSPRPVDAEKWASNYDKIKWSNRLEKPECSADADKATDLKNKSHDRKNRSVQPSETDA